MLMLVVLTGLGMTAAITIALVPSLVQRQQAQSAADAAALAGVTGGRQASLAIASANQATLIAFSRSGYAVTVTVQVGGQAASARATDEP
jgi:predicted MarR family transcription regulator